MVHGKKFFMVGSILAMSLMFVSLMFGFTVDGYSYDYYYSYYYSFSQYYPTIYWMFFFVVTSYIALGVVAIALYNKGIKAINVVNLAWTIFVYVFALVVSICAIDSENAVLALILLLVTIPVGFPFHLIAEILAMALPKKKATVQVAQPVVVSAPQTPVANSNAIAMLKQLKELYDAGILTEEEYNAKKQQYVEML